MRHCVGLVIVTNLPALGRTAIMQRRGVYDPEHMDWETFPGQFQVTCYGIISAGECFLNGLEREADEELGSAVGQIVADRRADLRLLLHQEDSRRLAMLYGLLLPEPTWLNKIRLHPASGGLYPLNRNNQPPNAFYFDGHYQAAQTALDIL